MKSQAAMVTFLAAFSVSAGAMPHASLNQLVQKSTGANCEQSGGDNGLGDLIQQVNLSNRQNPNPALQAKAPNDPRGLLKDMAPYLKIEKHSDHLRQVVGDLFCPGISYSSQGTATLISEDGTLLTNAHLLVDDKGKDKEALSSCFWQRKGSTEKLAIDVSTVKPLTRNLHDDFNKDLSIVRLKKPLHGVRPVKIDDSGIPLREGDQYLMVSATQEGMSNIKYTIRKIPTAGTFAEFVYSPDLIVQSCTNMSNSNGMWGDCSAVKGASGSAIFVVRGDDILFIGVHKAGGQPSADNKPFNLDRNAPGGRSYSYEIQMNHDISDQIQTLMASNDRGRTALSEQRADAR